MNGGESRAEDEERERDAQRADEIKKPFACLLFAFTLGLCFLLSAFRFPLACSEKASKKDERRR